MRNAFYQDVNLTPLFTPLFDDSDPIDRFNEPWALLVCRLINDEINDSDPIDRIWPAACWPRSAAR